MKNLLNKLLIPFAIIHIRIIQYCYKKITTENYSNRTNQNIAKLELLQAKEYYYENQFEAYGKFYPSFSQIGIKNHIRFMNWLFSEKEFKEWDIVIWYNPRAVTYYHNKIFRLQNNVSSLYEIDIPKQIKKWKQDYESNYK